MANLPVPSLEPLDNPATIHQKQFITRADLAQLLSVSVSSIDRGLKSGTLPFRPIRIGRRVLFPSSCVMDLSKRGAE